MAMPPLRAGLRVAVTLGRRADVAVRAGGRRDANPAPRALERGAGTGATFLAVAAFLTGAFAGFTARLAAGRFTFGFFAADFFAVTFFATDFLAADFLAPAFLAGFLAVDFF